MGRTPFRRAAVVLAAALVLAACGDDDPTTTATDDAAVDQTEAAASMDDPMDSDDGHGHGGHEIGDAEAIPTLAVTATPDAKAGVNLQVEVTDFAFAPEAASTEHVLGEGHAHVYVDGEKLGRVYGEWMYLGLDPGEHEIRVELNGNDHAPLLVEGEAIEQIVTVEVPESAAMDGHAHPDGFEAEEPHPTVSLSVTEDPKSGWNIRVETSDYTFAPEKASTMTTTSGEGHAHLYVDGGKITRLYGEWYHFAGDLTAGAHEVRVELSANDHSPYLADGAPIEDVVTITVAGDAGSDDTGTEMGGALEADEVIEVNVTGEVVENGGRHRVATGDTVALVVFSDVADEIHVHGYDIYADVVPGEMTVVEFVADLAGVWEVELHESGTALVELEVS